MCSSISRAPHYIRGGALAGASPLRRSVWWQLASWHKPVCVGVAVLVMIGATRFTGIADDSAAAVDDLSVHSVCRWQ